MLNIFLIFSSIFFVFAQRETTTNGNAFRPILLRLFPDFASVYRPAVSVPFDKNQLSNDQSFEFYNVTFSATEFSQISEESLTMLNAKVLKREILFHSEPNFEVAGTRYFYRRHVQQDEPIEIELVNPQDRLFREVLEPKRFFYLNSFENIQFIRPNPILPYYEVIFTCEHETLKKIDEDFPAFIYHDRSLGWSARYILNIPMFGVSSTVQLIAYADIRNRADFSFQIKQIELAAGDVKLLSTNDRTARSSSMKFASPMMKSSDEISFSYDFTGTALGEQASGVYFYDVKSLVDTILPAQSVQSVPLVKANVTVKSFVIYSSSFSTSNGQGKLIRSYNISSSEAFLPAGRWLFQERGRFLGEFDLDSLARSEIYTMKFGVDPDVVFRRKVSLIDRNEANQTISYNVEFSFVNAKEFRDITVEFRENFAYQKYFEVTRFPSQVSISMYGNEMRGEFVLPRNQVLLSFNYQVTIYENSPFRPRV